jgi:hypothetical protein
MGRKLEWRLTKTKERKYIGLFPQIKTIIISGHAFLLLKLGKTLPPLFGENFI